MLSDKPGKKLNTPVVDYVLFDLETTGTSCANDAVIEIAGVKVHDGAIIEEFSSFVNPERPIPYYASMVNGITDEMVEDAPIFEEVFADFLTFAGDHVLVGHNIQRFDMKFLYRDAEDYWDKTIGNDFVDTLDLARICLPELKHHKLTDLAEHYGIETEGAHRALTDCRMNQQVYECLKKDMKDPSKASKSVRKCPKCGNLLCKRSGRFGVFWGCTGYPDCRYTENA